MAVASKKNSPKDETGNVYGRLSVLRYSHKDKHGNRWWVCRCECGKETVTNGVYLRNGDTRSCGCAVLPIRREANKTHGQSKSRLYKIWQNMKNRCRPGAGAASKSYGDRGIRVCELWQNDFSAFSEWAYASGYDETAPKGQCTIDRIDVDGDYCPENCRWVGFKEQMNNTRRNHRLTARGETHTIPEWAAISGIPNKDIAARVGRGWPPERAIFEPLKKIREV